MIDSHKCIEVQKAYVLPVYNPRSVWAPDNPCASSGTFIYAETKEEAPSFEN